MAKKKTLGINIGFITNSSSVVHHFPLAMWEHPRVQAFAKAYGIDKNGYIGDNLWHRGQCESIAITREEKIHLQAELSNEDGYRTPSIDVDNDGPIIVYGDEYNGLAQTLDRLMRALHNEDQEKYPYISGDEYN